MTLGSALARTPTLNPWLSRRTRDTARIDHVPIPFTVRRCFPCLILPALLLVPLAVQAAPAEADAVFFKRAASCVAVLERDATDMAGRYKAGERSLKPGLVRLTEQGFAFVGRAYLRGLRKPEADRLIEEAKEAQKAMPAEALLQLSTGCRAEGAKLYAEANGFEQMIVSNRAKARVDKLLASKKP
jgi:hypothetical protein